MANYFTGGQADLFSFYRLPKILFADPRFRGISAEAKILYGLLLDRMSLSVKNGWLDSTGRVYIIFTTEEIMTSLYCADNKATKLMKELEGCGLIERKRRGLGKPNLIYVKNFASDPSEPRDQNRENNKSRGIKNNQNYTDLSDTDSFFSGETAGTESEGKDDRALYQDYFSQELGLDALTEANPEDEDMLREMRELLVDTVCSHRKMIRIAGDDKPFEVVKGQLMKLNAAVPVGFALQCTHDHAQFLCGTSTA